MEFEGSPPSALFPQREFEMIKGLIGSIIITSFFIIVPASAQEMDCSKAGMKQANAEMKKMPAGADKKMAMKEMKMAKSSMKKKDMEGCKTHMNKAMDMGSMTK